MSKLKGTIYMIIDGEVPDNQPPGQMLVTFTQAGVPVSSVLHLNNVEMTGSDKIAAIICTLHYVLDGLTTTIEAEGITAATDRPPDGEMN